MKTNVGLWIDMKKAVIVFITGNDTEIKIIESNVDSQQGRINGVRSLTPYESLQVPADDSQQRDLTGHLHIYYDKVIDSIRDGHSVFIFGPGETKINLLKRMEKNKINGIVKNIETAGRMTDPQIAAKVRKYFLDNCE
jgi:hypothetical protein